MDLELPGTPGNFLGLLGDPDKNPGKSREIQDLSRLRFLLADLEFVAELGSAVKWHIVLILLNLFKKYQECTVTRRVIVRCVISFY